MRNVPTLLRRELGAYFSSPMGYVMLLLFLLVMGFIFAVVLAFLNRGPTQLTPMGILFSMFWVPSVVVIPLITMRLLAEEKRQGTIEMLMTAPVTDFEVVMAKYLGAVLLYTIMWAGTGLYVVIVDHYARTAMLDLGPILSGYVGVLIIGQFCIAIGVFASSLTKNQVAAALVSFAVIFLLTLGVSWMEYLFRGGELGTFFRAVSPVEHMDGFQRGIIDLRPVVWYVSGAVLALFLTVRVVESRKWR